MGALWPAARAFGHVKQANPDLKLAFYNHNVEANFKAPRELFNPVRNCLHNGAEVQSKYHGKDGLQAKCIQLLKDGLLPDVLPKFQSGHPYANANAIDPYAKPLFDGNDIPFSYEWMNFGESLAEFFQLLILQSNSQCGMMY